MSKILIEDLKKLVEEATAPKTVSERVKIAGLYVTAGLGTAAASPWTVGAILPGIQSATSIMVPGTGSYMIGVVGPMMSYAAVPTLAPALGFVVLGAAGAYGCHAVYDKLKTPTTT